MARHVTSPGGPPAAARGDLNLRQDCVHRRKRSIRYVPGPKGSPENPMTLDKVAAKFHLLVDPVLGRERAERLATLVAKMETLENVQHLTAMLR